MAAGSISGRWPSSSGVAAPNATIRRAPAATRRSTPRFCGRLRLIGRSQQVAHRTIAIEEIKVECAQCRCDTDRKPRARRHVRLIEPDRENGRHAIPCLTDHWRRSRQYRTGEALDARDVIGNATHVVQVRQKSIQILSCRCETGSAHALLLGG